MLEGSINAESCKDGRFAFMVVISVKCIQTNGALFESVLLERKRILIAETTNDNKEIVAHLLELEGMKASVRETERFP